MESASTSTTTLPARAATTTTLSPSTSEAPTTTTAVVTTITTTTPVLPGIPPCTAGTSILPVIRPPTVFVVCNTAVGVSGITWSSWGTVTAVGLGTAAVNDCKPDGASGTVQRFPASIYVFGASMATTPVFQDITPTGGEGQTESSYMPGSWGVP